MAFSRFISSLAEGAPAEIYGDGSQTRDFTFVSDVVSAFTLAAERGRKGVVYNIGGGERAPLSRCLDMIADALGVELGGVACEAAFAVATKDLDLGVMKIDEGCVAGVEASWQGRVGERTVIDLKVRWRKGQHLEPDWPLEHGYLVEIEGRPCVRTKLEIRPTHDFEASSFEDFMQLGMIMTGLPAVNAIPAVCSAPPGIVTYTDLPLITGAGFVSS